MEWIAQERTDVMGKFHNDVVAILDANGLTPIETVAVLKILISTIERLFETTVKANNGDNLEKNIP